MQLGNMQSRWDMQQEMRSGRQQDRYRQGEHASGHSNQLGKALKWSARWGVMTREDKGNNSHGGGHRVCLDLKLRERL